MSENLLSSGLLRYTSSNALNLPDLALPLALFDNLAIKTKERSASADSQLEAHLNDLMRFCCQPL
jgi:hypothetical protein